MKIASRYSINSDVATIVDPSQDGARPLPPRLGETVLTNSQLRSATGATIFEMSNIEAPAHWSQSAVDILAQKYLRRAGVPSMTTPIAEDNVPNWLQRSRPHPEATFGGETSAFQLFHRLAGCCCAMLERQIIAPIRRNSSAPA